MANYCDAEVKIEGKDVKAVIKELKKTFRVNFIDEAKDNVWIQIDAKWNASYLNETLSDLKSRYSFNYEIISTEVGSCFAEHYWNVDGNIGSETRDYYEITEDNIQEMSSQDFKQYYGIDFEDLDFEEDDYVQIGNYEFEYL